MANIDHVSVHRNLDSVDSDLIAKIETAAHEGAFGCNPRPIPTEAQCSAGNYKLGRVEWRGLKLAIEQPRNSYREGTDKHGNRWRTRLAAHYGYVSNTRGADGDPIDCFIGTFPTAETAYVINQNVDGRFDEHKLMLCFESEPAAILAYLDSYDRGWNGLHSLVPASITQLRWWLQNGNLSRPLTPESLPYEGNSPMQKPLRNVYWDSACNPVEDSLPQILYRLRADEPGNDLLMDAVTLDDIYQDDGVEGVLNFDAMVTPFAKLETKLKVLQAVMDRSGGEVKVSALQISEPYKQGGRANVAAVFELSDGQTVSVFFHNPDVNPSKIQPSDELISWKWLLNKKDVTIVVAPEKGHDLNVREVARRLMKLAEKNSPSFARANAKRADRMQNIENLKGEVTKLEGELSDLQHQIEVAKVEKEERDTRITAVITEILANDGRSGDAEYVMGKLAKAGGYSAIVDDPAQWDRYDDLLDPLISQRVIDVRNALRELGWDDDGSQPMRSGPLKKGNYTLDYEFKRTRTNVISVAFKIGGVTGFFMSDTLTLLADEMAARINMGIPKETVQPAPDVAAIASRYGVSADILTPQLSYLLVTLARPDGLKATLEARHSGFNVTLHEDNPRGASGTDIDGLVKWFSEASKEAAPEPEPTPKADEEIGPAGERESYPESATSEFSGPSRPFDEYVSEAGGDTFEAAIAFFKTELKGKIVKTVIGDVHLTGAGFKEMKRGMKSDGLKARLISHVPEILSGGRYDGRTESHKTRGDGFIAFHFFEKDVDVAGAIVTAGVNVGERDGALYELPLSAYGLGYEGLPNWQKLKAHQTYPGMSQGPDEPQNGENATLDSILGEYDGGINIVILKVINKETGERLYDLEDDVGQEGHESAPAEEPTETPAEEAAEPAQGEAEEAAADVEAPAASDELKIGASKAKQAWDEQIEKSKEDRKGDAYAMALDGFWAIARALFPGFPDGGPKGLTSGIYYIADSMNFGYLTDFSFDAALARLKEADAKAANAVAAIDLSEKDRYLSSPDSYRSNAGVA